MGTMMGHGSTALRFGLVIVVMMATHVSSTPGQTQGCQQPNPAGCPVELSQAASAVLADPDETHVWLLTLTDACDLRAVLTGSGEDLRLYVYGPDGWLVGASDNLGRATEVVEANGATAGLY